MVGDVLEKKKREARVEETDSRGNERVDQGGCIRSGIHGGHRRQSQGKVNQSITKGRG